MRYFARGLTEMGHRVWVITLSPSTAAQTGESADGWCVWQDVRYRQADGWDPRFRRRSLPARAAYLLPDMHRDGRLACREIERLHRDHGLDVVIGYSCYQIGMDRIMTLCQRLRIPLVNDVVEWLASDSFAGGRLNPMYWDSIRAIRGLLPRSDGIIAISSYLEDWFSQKGIPTLRIPAIIDPGPQPPARDSVSPIRPFTLCYLGNMVDRDGPMLMINAVREVVATGHDVVFNVVGATERIPAAQRAKAIAAADPQLRDRVRFCGRVSDAEVARHLHESDALIFTRVSGRASEAAFPTRLPEYLASGTPVIASDVSDIGEYLIDGVEALVVPPDSAAALAAAVVRLLKLPDRGRAMGLAGRAKCESCFHYRTRMEQVVAYLEEQMLAPLRTSAAALPAN